jgi:hypothetical protein
MLNAKNRGIQEDRINVMERMTMTQRGGRIYPVNPVHPVTCLDMNEIIGKFRGADQLREAVGQLQTLLYAE